MMVNLSNLFSNGWLPDILEDVITYTEENSSSYSYSCTWNQSVKRNTSYRVETHFYLFSRTSIYPNGGQYTRHCCGKIFQKRVERTPGTIFIPAIHKDTPTTYYATNAWIGFVRKDTKLQVMQSHLVLVILFKTN